MYDNRLIYTYISTIKISNRKILFFNMFIKNKNYNSIIYYYN